MGHSASRLVLHASGRWTALVSVPFPRWLVYRLLDVCVPTNPLSLGQWPHPALTGGRVPAVLDSSWLVSGEGLRDTHPDVYATVQRMFDEGTPPVVHVAADHGAWGYEAEDLGVRLAGEVDWDDHDPAAVPIFRGMPGYRYSGDTLDRVVFARPGTRPVGMNSYVERVNELRGVGPVDELLHGDPSETLERLRPLFRPNVAGQLWTASDDVPACLIVVAGERLAPGMVPGGFVLGVWEVRGDPSPDGKGGDFHPVTTPATAALRASLTGTILPLVSPADRVDFRWAGDDPDAAG